MSLIRIPRAEAVVALSFVSLLFALPLQAQTDDLIDITTLEQLNAIRYDMDGDGRPSSTGETAWKAAFTSLSSATVDDSDDIRYSSSTYMGYELMNDLDFEDATSYAGSRNDDWVDPDATIGGTTDTPGWLPIGDNANPFIAVFEGNHHTISNLYMNRTFNRVGLFGVLGSGGEVRNVGIVGGSVTGNVYVGGLVGTNSGIITACYATGTAAAVEDVGGLVGNNDSGGTISACYATGNVEATADDGSAGGLVGWNEGTITASYATGNAEATGTDSNAGGLVGLLGGSISACYATGTATATGAGGLAGGLVGYNESGTISACYATGTATATGAGGRAGGLVGYNESGTINNSYFDHDTAGTGFTSADTDAQSTSALITPTVYDDDVTSDNGSSIYEAWNVDVDDADDDETLDTGVDDPWDFGTSSQYPALKVDFDGNSSATAYEFGGQGRSAPTLAVAPAAPTGFSAGSPTTNSVELSWTAPIDTHTGFIVKYSTTMGFDPASEGTEFMASAIAADATGVTVTGLSSGTTYYFRVAAVNGVTIGIYAAEVSATTIAPPPAPPNNGDISLIDITTPRAIKCDTIRRGWRWSSICW